MRDNGCVVLTKAFLQESEFQAAIARAAEQLAPDVVEIRASLGENWRGDESVFFTVILADAATNRDRLLAVSKRVQRYIEWEVEPLEQWGVLPYFKVRSQSEQADIDRRSRAS
jgi:hypothetical protein